MSAFSQYGNVQQPFSRRAAAGVMFNGRFHVYGGFGVSGTVRANDVGRDLWRYAGHWELVEEKGPIAARYPSLCADGADIWLFGGCGWDQSLGVIFSHGMWLRRQEHWERMDCKGPEPSGRYTSLLAMGPRGLCVFGGHSQDAETGKTFYGDLWVFDPAEKRWEHVHDVEKGPGPRYGFGWAADQDGAWLYGGFDGAMDRGDLWRLDLSRLHWECMAEEGQGPVPRYCPSLGVVSKGVVLFGGRSKVKPKENYSDTWVFDNTGWRRLDVSNGPGYHAKSAYASDGDRFFLFGGEGPRGHVSDLWRFDGSGWERLHDSRNDDPILW